MIAKRERANMERALIASLTHACEQAKVTLDSPARHVDVDSEQACQRAHGGNWRRRLAQRGVHH